MSVDWIELSIMREAKVRAKTLKIFIKVTDGFCWELKDNNGELLRAYEDTYVPYWIPWDYGDYLDLEIDIETWVIKNWSVPTTQELENDINNNED